jgi:hypothetical protein
MTVFLWALKRLMAFSAVYVYDGVDTNSSDVTILLMGTALLHRSRPVIGDGLQIVVAPEDPLIDRCIERHWWHDLYDKLAELPTQYPQPVNLGDLHFCIVMCITW